MPKSGKKRPHLNAFVRLQQGITPKYLLLKPNILQKPKALF